MCLMHYVTQKTNNHIYNVIKSTIHLRFILITQYYLFKKQEDGL